MLFVDVFALKTRENTIKKAIFGLFKISLILFFTLGGE